MTQDATVEYCPVMPTPRGITRVPPTRLSTEMKYAFNLDAERNMPLTFIFLVNADV